MFIVAVIGGYYAYAQYTDNKYYDSYRLQYYNAGKAGDLFMEVYNSSTNSSLTNTQWNNNYPDMIKNLDDAITFENTRKYYINQMINSSNSDLKKQYANLLSSQTDLTVTYFNLFKDLLTAFHNKDTKRSNEISFNATLDAINNNNNQREEIRAKNPEFTKLLNQQVDESKNATNT